MNSEHFLSSHLIKYLPNGFNMCFVIMSDAVTLSVKQIYPQVEINQPEPLNVQTVLVWFW